jgi:hypothetical protein
LTKASHRIAEEMYKAQQSAGTPGGQGPADGNAGHAGTGPGGSSQSGGQGDVVDAEFVDVNDSKKPN